MFGTKLGEKGNEVASAIRACRIHFVAAAFFAVFVNALALTYPIFMMQVFDRVVSSRSVETLIALSIGVVIALIFRGVFHWLRGRLLILASARIDRMLSDRVLTALFERSGSARRDTGSQVLRDLDAFRQFWTGKGALTAMDLPWAGMFVGLLWMVDWVVGSVAIGCMVVMSALVLINAVSTKRALREATTSANLSYQFVEANLRSADAIIAMGMTPGILRRWNVWRGRAMDDQIGASGRSATITAILDNARIGGQALILSVGVLRVLESNVPLGFAFFGVILFGLAMRPIDAAVASWDGYQRAKDALERIKLVLQDAPPRTSGMPLPRPSGRLSVEGVVYVPRGMDRPILRGVGLQVEPGTTLGIIGPMGSGKSTLVRLLVGILQPTRGTVRLDGSDVWRRTREDLGKFLGYLPQEIGLVAGTVADNISRFGQFDEQEIVDAAQLAGAHEIILALPNGYDTMIGEGGHPISGGQRQLIGLARAVVGLPAIVVLDEPNSNLDGPGEASLVSCIDKLKAAGTTVVMVSHRPNLVRDMDQLAALSSGSIIASGPSKVVLDRMRRPAIAAVAES